MNKHEEARNNAFNILPKSIGSKSSQLKLKYYFEVDRYIKQSEATEKELEGLKKATKALLNYIDDNGYSDDTVNKNHFIIDIEDSNDELFDLINNVLSKVGK